MQKDQIVLMLKVKSAQDVEVIWCVIRVLYGQHDLCMHIPFEKPDRMNVQGRNIQVDNMTEVRSRGNPTGSQLVQNSSAWKAV